MRRAPIVLFALSLVAAACGSGTSPQAERAETSLPDPPAPVTTQASRATTTPSAVVADEPPDFTLFVAAVDSALRDTTYQDAAFAETELFIATGQLFCEYLDAGASTDEVLGAHLDAMEEARGGSLTDDDVLVAGVVMGASVEVLCPRHAP